MKKINFNKIIKNKYNLLLLLSVFVYLFFGLFHITKSVTTDEQFWIYERIPKYWEAVSELRAKNTHINDKPGVTLAIVSGTGLFFEKNPEANHKIKDENLDSYNVHYTEKLNLFFRLPIFIFSTFVIFFIFWITRKITDNKWIALWTATLIFLYPILLGISRIVNPDALLWSLVFSSALSYLALIKYDEKKYLILATLFTGLSLLTKYVANILFPFFIITIFLFFIFNFKSKFESKIKEVSTYFKKHLQYLFIIFTGSSLLFLLLMPAAIFKPKFLYWGTIGAPGFELIFLPMIIFLILIFYDNFFFNSKIIYLLGAYASKFKNLLIYGINGTLLLLISITFFNWISHQKIIDLTRIPIDARSKDIFTEGTSFFQKILLELYPFVFSLPPIVLFFMMLAIVFAIYKKSFEHTVLVTSTSFLIIIFFLGGIISGILFTPRYDIIIFPFTALLASLGIYEFIKYKKIRNIISPTFASIILIIISTITLFKAMPFYYNYASFLLPKEYTTNNTWGFGGYQASQYLNSLPNAQNITVWSDYRGTCEFFVGKCIIDRDFDKKEYPIDYYVLTRRGQSRVDYSHLNMFKEMKIEPSWELLIGDREKNFIKIFKAKEE